VSWLKDLLGGVNLVVGLWAWLGALASIFYAIGILAGTNGLEVFAHVVSYLGVPGGFLDTVDHVAQWFTDRSGLIGPVSSIAAALTLSVMFCGSYSRYTVPSSPAPSTFYVALLIGQVAGGLDVLFLIVMTLVICICWWFMSENGRGATPLWHRIGNVFVDLINPLAFVLLTVGFALLWPKEPDKRVVAAV